MFCIIWNSRGESRQNLAKQWPLLSPDNFCKQFGPRSECQVRSGSEFQSVTHSDGIPVFCITCEAWQTHGDFVSIGVIDNLVYVGITLLVSDQYPSAISDR